MCFTMFRRGAVAVVGDGVVRAQDGAQDVGMDQDQEATSSCDLKSAVADMMNHGLPSGYD